MTVDLSTLWDYSDPALSEQRFQAALPLASTDDTIILQTQIARTYGLRGNFAQAQQILNSLVPHLTNARIEAQVWHALELGRSYASATHPPESQTDQAKALARSAYAHAIELAQTAKLDSLAIDALHMLAFVDPAPADQLAWNRKAIILLENSSQPDAQKWAGPLHNNAGYALYALGRYAEALDEFKLALAAHERGGKPQNIRIAHWMVAWTLRALNRLDEALAIQLRLEKECDEAGEPDPYVFEELEQIYRSMNDDERANFYANRRKAN